MLWCVSPRSSLLQWHLACHGCQRRKVDSGGVRSSSKAWPNVNLPMILQACGWTQQNPIGRQYNQCWPTWATRLIMIRITNTSLLCSCWTWHLRTLPRSTSARPQSPTDMFITYSLQLHGSTEVRTQGAVLISCCQRRSTCKGGGGGIRAETQSCREPLPDALTGEECPCIFNPQQQREVRPSRLNPSTAPGQEASGTPSCVWTWSRPASSDEDPRTTMNKIP